MIKIFYISGISHSHSFSRTLLVKYSYNCHFKRYIDSGLSASKMTALPTWKLKQLLLT